MIETTASRSRKYRDRQRQKLALLPDSKYMPSRGGHAPDDLRNAFDQVVGNIIEYRSNDLVELGGIKVTGSEVCGVIWNCTDSLNEFTLHMIKDMFRALLDEISIPETYGQAARLVKTHKLSEGNPS